MATSAAEVFLKKLRQLFDARVFQRGQGYFRQNRVKHIEVSERGQDVIVAGTVRGSRMYHTTLILDPRTGEVTDMTCTCPYEFACKHAAALGMAYADMLKEGEWREAAGGTAGPTPPALAPAAFEDVAAALHNFGIPVEQGNVRASRERAFRPQDYFLQIHTYNQILSLRKKDEPHQIASVKKLLALDLTASERLALTFLRDAALPDSPPAPEDYARFWSLIAEIGMPVRVDWQQTAHRVVVSQSRLKAELLYEEMPQPWIYAEEAEDAERAFVFRMPEEYWRRNRGAYGADRPFVVFPGCVLYRAGSTLEVYPLPLDLIRLIARVYEEPYYLRAKKSVYHYQTLLEESEIARFDELSQLATQHLDMRTPLPPFTVETHATLQPTFIVDFDSRAARLRVSPVLDYGCFQQDVGESIFMSQAGGARRLERRSTIRYRGTHIIIVEGNVIHAAAINKEKEIELYRELSERAPQLGFTKTLKCLREGGKISAYLSMAWPQLTAYAEAKGYPIIFTKDAIAIAHETFRADFSADMAADHDWLQFDVACYCGGDKITLDALRAYLKSGEAFLRKPDGTLVAVENREDMERLVRMLEHFEQSEEGFKGKAYHAPELEYLMSSSAHYNAARAKSFKAFMREMQKGKPVEKVRVPAVLSKVLRPYQTEGVKWLHFLRSYRFAGILADDMGLGKTLQTLALLSMTRTEGKPSLIVCPKTLLYNWEAEARKFTPDLKVVVYEGAPEARASLQKTYAEYDVIVTSYPIFKRDESFFTDKKTLFNYVILDEAQYIKNHASQNAHLVKKAHADYRLALTGTPLENNVTELWSIFDFLMPGFLGTHEHFMRHFHKPIMDDGDARALEHLKRKAEVFMLRRTKAEVLAELPPKVEQKRACILGTDQNVLYQQILAKVRTDIFHAVEREGFKRSQIHILAGLTKLRQVCNHPALLAKGDDWHEYESAKLDTCLEIVEEIAAEGRKVLVFSQFTSMLDILSEALDERTIAHRYLSGKTRNRQELVDAFNTDPKVPVFLISLKAGGTGLNLTAADTVIVFDPWWNPSVENQAIDRAHRIGQTKSVNVYRLVTRGTIEEKIQALQEKKQSLFDAVVNESKDLFKKLTWDDVRELFA